MGEQGERYTFFWRKESAFSQMHPAQFTAHGVFYTCAEQYMMHQKALTFGDDETATLILQAKDPKVQKGLGRKVKNFDQRLWNKKCGDIVKEGNLAKFSQNLELRRALFETVGTVLAEASPVDIIWGIGLTEDNPRAQRKATWRGENKLGYILTDVRQQLMNSSEFSEEAKTVISAQERAMSRAEIEAGIKKLLFTSQPPPTQPSPAPPFPTTAPSQQQPPPDRSTSPMKVHHPQVNTGSPVAPSPPNPGPNKRQRLREKQMSALTGPKKYDEPRAGDGPQTQPFFPQMPTRSCDLSQNGPLIFNSSRPNVRNAPRTKQPSDDDPGACDACVESPTPHLNSVVNGCNLTATLGDAVASPPKNNRRERKKKKMKEREARRKLEGSASPEKEWSGTQEELTDSPVQDPAIHSTTSEPLIKPNQISEPAQHNPPVTTTSSPARQSPKPLLPTPTTPSSDKDAETVRQLEKEHIFVRKKKFPRFICRLCDCHCDNVPQCYKHIKDKRHQRLKTMREMDGILRDLPAPSPSHLAAVEKLLQETLADQAMTNMAERCQAVGQLTATVKSVLRDSELVLYGSSLTGCGLRDSDINLDISADDAPLILQDIFNLLSKDTSGYYSDVSSDFRSSVPSMSLNMVEYKLRVHITLNNSRCCQTSRMMALYTALDPRVSKLAVLFRYWAKLCKIDNQQVGTFPSYVYYLLVIFYLQRSNPPVLPVLHELVKPDPKKPGSEHEYLEDIKAVNDVWRCRNTSNLAELWVQMLRFFAVDFDMTVGVVCIRQKDPVTRSDKRWNSRKLAVEDPFQRRWNVLRTVSHHQIFEYVQDRILSAYRYFGTPQTKKGSVSIPTPPISTISDHNVDTTISSCPSKDNGSGVTPPMVAETESLPPHDVTDLIGDISKLVFNKGDNSSEIGQNSSGGGTPQTSNVKPEEPLYFTFNTEALSDFKGPSIFCSICQQQGHLKKSCPEEHLPPLTALPPMTAAFRKCLDAVVSRVPRDFEPQKEDLYIREQVRQELQAYIRVIHGDAMLSLFGSSCNGFGFQYSDLDLSLTFSTIPEDKAEEMLNCEELIVSLTRYLRHHQGLSNVRSVTTAKVPIIQFRHHQSRLDGDISLYNSLAQHNTRMLLLYSQIDWRVRALGYTMKVLAKCCDICDASQGSLSSYAYTLMVVFFLQQRNPPVLPVLQQLYDGEKKPERIVDGWNVWFFDDLKQLPKVWKHCGENKELVGDLWNGLLQFYTQEFNLRDFVISIRQHEPMAKFPKMWNSKCICIEDPFELSRNLGAGLSRKMNLFIIKALRKARVLFGSPFDDLPPKYRTVQDYFFDPHLLTEGSRPNDRGCRVCGKIGHFMKECPFVLARKGRLRKEKAVTDNMDDERDTHAQHTPPHHRDTPPKHAPNRGSTPIAIPRTGCQRSLSMGHTPPYLDPGLSTVLQSPPHQVTMMHHTSPHVFFPEGSSPPATLSMPYYLPAAAGGTAMRATTSPASSPLFVAMPTAPTNTGATAFSHPVTMARAASLPACFYVPNNFVYTTHSFMGRAEPCSEHRATAAQTQPSQACHVSGAEDDGQNRAGKTGGTTRRTSESSQPAIDGDGESTQHPQSPRHRNAPSGRLPSHFPKPKVGSGRIAKNH